MSFNGVARNVLIIHPDTILCDHSMRVSKLATAWPSNVSGKGFIDQLYGKIGLECV